jgi:hypothetical protein
MNKKIILIMAALCLFAFSVPAFAAEADVFSDVPANHWSYQAVKKLTQDGIIVGDAGRFNGDKGLTRYEMAVLVGNAMTKIEKADAEQKKMIDKLGREYNAELTKLGARLAKVEAKSKVNFFFDNRIEYTHTSLGQNDGGAAFGGDGKITQKNQLMERMRMYMNVPVGDKWEWNSRLVQAKWNINSSTGSDGFRFDRFWLTNKDFLGGTLEVGKMMLYPGKGAFYGDTGDVEGLYYTKTMDKLTVRLGTARKGGTGPTAELPNIDYRSSDLKFAEVTYRPTKTSDIGFYTLKNDFVGSVKLAPGVGVSYNLEDIDLRAINGAVELPGGLALSGEYATNKANGTGYKDKDGYFIALQSRYKATNYMPALYTSMVNPFVQGDNGWAVSYRRLESGVSGAANRGAFSWVPLTTDQDGTWQNSYDGIKAWRFDYITVPWKNVQLTLTYDRIKPLNGDWTNNSYQSTFNFFF